MNDATTQASFLTPTEVARRTGFSKWHLARLRHEGRGPRYFRLGYRTVRYAASDVDAWLMSRAELQVAA